jgi:DNA topoisomerase-1
MRLVIVESPNKTRKIRDFLGPGYVVTASFGHVRDLPPTGGLGVAFAGGRVTPTYQPLEKAGRAIAELTRLAAKAEEILLATDPDREGEAIAWHIAELLQRPCRRVTFQAITKDAVMNAMQAPRQVDQHLVDAQQARRVLDRVVGWLVSPTLRAVGKEAKSAGRVQSVALRIVAEREAEIRAFVKADFFTLSAKLTPASGGRALTAELIRWKGEPLAHRLADGDTAEKTVAWCRKQPWQVLHCERRESAKPPPPPFTTATVQQAASVALKLAPDATMKLLQELFEDGHITYHRTDSVALAPEAIAAARALIARDFPPDYLPPSPVIHGQKSANAQEAHEAIRPTHPEETPALGGDRAALYDLIRTRFLACQMAAGRDAVTTLDVACAPGAWNGGPMGVFQAKGLQVLFDGWRKMTADATEEPKRKTKEDAPVAARLPTVEAGDALTLEDLAAKAKSTKPPPRYTQASLIKKLEALGVGRPSTYAATLATLFARTYVGEEKRLLLATDLGMAVTDFLKRFYGGDFIDPDYTARMEGALDAVARGERDWQDLVTHAASALLVRAKTAGLRGDPLAGT